MTFSASVLWQRPKSPSNHDQSRNMEMLVPEFQSVFGRLGTQCDCDLGAVLEAPSDSGLERLPNKLTPICWQTT